VTANVTAASGSVTNGAAVAAPSGVMDTNGANDTASDVDTVVSLPLPAIADLALTVMAAPGTVASGGVVTYTLTIVNNGPAGVTEAVVTDTPPAGVGFGNWTCSVTNAGSGALTTACGATSGSGNVSTTATLNPGATITYVISATVSAGASGNLIDAARVDVPAGTTDSSPANNASAAPITVQAPPPPPPQFAEPIPTLNEWGLIALSLLMLTAAALSMRRRAPGR